MADKHLRVRLRQGVKLATIISSYRVTALVSLHSANAPPIKSFQQPQSVCTPNHWLLLEFWVGDLQDTIEDYKPLKGSSKALFIPLFLICNPVPVQRPMSSCFLYE